MTLVATRSITWSNTDLGTGNVSSEIIDVRDLRSPMALCTLSGAPQGSFQVWGFIGVPVKTATGLDWSSVDSYMITSTAASGTTLKVPYNVVTPLSGLQFIYNRTAGSGTIKGFFQAKETRTQ